MKNRKFWLFVLTLVIVAVMSYFDKDTATIVALYGTYCCGNVGAKFSSNIVRKE